MKAYLDLLQHVLANGTPKSDRTGTGTISTFGHQIRIDLQKGFPLLTTKKVHLKSIIHELLWFLSGDTNIKYLQENGVKIWDAWQDPVGGLGYIYGHQWRNLEVIKKIKPIHHVNRKRISYPLWPLGPQTIYSDETHSSQEYGDFKIINQYNKIVNGKNRIVCDIQFQKTGYISKSVRKDAITIKSIKDPYYPKYYDIGYIGEPDRTQELYKELKKTWESMLQRCYDQKCKQYKNYGLRGIFVNKSWHNFANFLNDCKNLRNWQSKLANPKTYELDKDYLGANCYSVDTCIWLSRSENNSLKTFFTGTSPYNITYLGTNLSSFSQQHGLNPNGISACLNNKRTHHHNWKFEKINNGYLYRIEKIDQIKNLVNNIKLDQCSRRHLIVGYNVAQLEESSLPPCHSMAQFYVNDGKISCQLYQRSADAFLGVPFNIASYALLTLMIAQVCELEPNEFIHTFGDLHIYNNHMEQVNLQLGREPRSLPKIKLNTEVNDIFSFKYEDFKLEDYNPYPRIKAKVAV